VGLPFSKNQVRKLGQRLREDSVPSEADLGLVNELLEAYRVALDSAISIITKDLALNPSPRLKNLGTIIEKLRRNRNSHLGNIRDIAGMRITLQKNSRLEQDRIRDLIISRFSGRSYSPGM
jgi:ppGpp synthetase/RelA/SpoT-type nucleotidyltranferase